MNGTRVVHVPDLYEVGLLLLLRRKRNVAIRSRNFRRDEIVKNCPYQRVRSLALKSKLIPRETRDDLADEVLKKIVRGVPPIGVATEVQAANECEKRVGVGAVNEGGGANETEAMRVNGVGGTTRGKDEATTIATERKAEIRIASGALAAAWIVGATRKRAATLQVAVVGHGERVRNDDVTVGINLKEMVGARTTRRRGSRHVDANESAIRLVKTKSKPVRLCPRLKLTTRKLIVTRRRKRMGSLVAYLCEIAKTGANTTIVAKLE